MRGSTPTLARSLSVPDKTCKAVASSAIACIKSLPLFQVVVVAVAWRVQQEPLRARSRVCVLVAASSCCLPASLIQCLAHAAEPLLPLLQPASLAHHLPTPITTNQACVPSANTRLSMNPS